MNRGKRGNVTSSAAETLPDAHSASSKSPITPEEADALKSAPKATLDAKARSANAKRITTRLADDLAAWEAHSGHRTNKRRDKRLVEFQSAIASFLADMLHAHNHPQAKGWTWRSLDKAGFTGQTVSFRDFKALMDGWTACGLLERIAGFKEPVAFEAGDQGRARGKASRFRATLKLLTLCAEYGVTPQNAGEHFAYAPPEHPLRLRAASKSGAYWKEKGRLLKFKQTPQTARLEQCVKALNTFLAQYIISGATHRWFHRTFNMGDHKDFAWNKGGRLYSDGKDSYQSLPDTKRLKIRINGEGVCEIDIRASYLTIFHAIHHVPLLVTADHDPYQIPGLPRNVVKAWCTVRFGTKGPRQRWPSDVVKQYQKDNHGADLTKYKIKDVEKKVCQKLPLMARWREVPETWADLMWLESEAVVSTMTLLMHSGVPSLPVHDSLIVPRSAEAMAIDVLSNNYSHVCGVIPALVVHRLQ